MVVYITTTATPPPHIDGVKRSGTVGQVGQNLLYRWYHNVSIRPTLFLEVGQIEEVGQIH